MGYVQVFKTVDDVTMCPGAHTTTMCASAVDAKSTDAEGKFKMLKIPAMTPRVHFKITGPPIGSEQDPIPTVQLEMRPMNGMPLDTLVSVSRFTARAVAGIVGVNWDNETTGLLGGSVRDCQNSPVSNAQIFAFENETPLDDSKIYYFAESPRLPVRHTQQYYTSRNGIFGVLNLAPGKARVQVKGRLMDGGPIQLLSNEEVPVFADALTVVLGIPLLMPAQ
jgi:hypothetical protein